MRRFRDTTGLYRWNKENRAGTRRRMNMRIGQTTQLLVNATMGLSDDELIAKSAAIRAEWDKAHNARTEPRR